MSPGEYLVFSLGQAFEGVVSQRAPYQFAINKIPGLSTGSGTVELLLFSGTSFETQTAPSINIEPSPKSIPKNLGMVFQP